MSATAWEAAVTSEPVPSVAEQQARTERELAHIVTAALRQNLDGAEQVAVRRRAVHGPAGPALVAQSHGAALLIVGSHRHRWIAELLHESTNSYCARHATCPVLVIPPAIATRREAARARALAATTRGPLAVGCATSAIWQMF